MRVKIIHTSSNVLNFLIAISFSRANVKADVKYKNLQENHTDDIWNSSLASNAKVAFSGETRELGLGPQWAEEYLEQSIENVDAPSAQVGENPNFAYSKFMKFMRQEGDLPIEASPVTKTEELDDKWSSEFSENKSKELTGLSTVAQEADSGLSAIDDQNAAAGTWVNEFVKKKTAEGRSEFLNILILTILRTGF